MGLALPDSAECIVTSAEKKLTLAVSEGIIAVGDGTAARRATCSYGADNEGIGLSPFYQFDGPHHRGDPGAIDEAFGGMADGSLDPCRAVRRCASPERPIREPDRLTLS